MSSIFLLTIRILGVTPSLMYNVKFKKLISQKTAGIFGLGPQRCKRFKKRCMYHADYAKFQ